MLQLLYVQQLALVWALWLQVCHERLIPWNARPGGQTGLGTHKGVKGFSARDMGALGLLEGVNIRK